MKQNKNKKLFAKIFQNSFFVIIGLVLLVGSGFGLYKYHNIDSFKKGEIFSTTAELEIDVINKPKDVSLTKIANNFMDELEWFGYSNSDVSIVDSNTLKVTYIPNYVNSTAFNSKNVDSDFVKYSNGSLAANNKELLSLYTSLFFSGNVEFRAGTEENLFSINPETRQIEFNEPTPPPEPSSLIKQTSTSSSNNFDEFDIKTWTQVDNIDSMLDLNAEVTDSPKLIEKAKVEYKNGNSYIKLTPTAKALPVMREAATFLKNAYNKDTNPQGNLFEVWIGYDTLNSLVQKATGETIPEGQTLQYAFTDSNGKQSKTIRPIAKPFLLTYNVVKSEIAPRDETISLSDPQGKQHAQMVVNRINNAGTNFDFKLKGIKYNQNKLSPIIIKIIMIIFIIIIILVIFTFGWWFGLMGMTVASGNAVVMMTMLSLAFISGVQLGIMFVLGLFIVEIFSILLTWYSLKVIKENLIDGLSWKNQYKKFFKSQSKTFFLLVVFVLPTLIFILITYEFIRLNLVLMILTFYISFALILVLSFLSLSVIIISTSKKSLKEGISNEKWNLTFGRANVTSNQHRFSKWSDFGFADKVNAKKANKKGILSFSIIIVLGIIASIILSSVGFGGFNTSLQNNNDFQYDIVRVLQEETNGKDYYYNSLDGWVNGYKDPINYNDNMELLRKDESKIKKLFKKYISVKTINENFGTTFYTNEKVFPDPETIDFPYDPSLETVYKYGYSLFSNKHLSNEEIITINDALSNIGGQVNTVKGMMNYHYELQTNRSSITDGIASKETIASVLPSDSVKKVFLTILLILIIFFFFNLFVNKWSGATAMMNSFILESLLGIMILPLLFVPITTTIIFVIPIMLTISLALKFLPINKFLKEFPFHEDDNYSDSFIENEIDKVFKKQRKTLFSIFIVTIATSLLLLLFFKIYALSIFVFVVTFTLVMIYNQLFILPTKFKELEIGRRNHEKKVFAKYYEESLDSEYLDEEYIKGINY